MKLTIIGAGYVGLVTAVCMAVIGHEICCVEKNQNKLKKLKKGEPTIYEPGLEEMLKEINKENKIIFTDDIKEGVFFSDYIFLCVGTPQGEDGHADLSQVEETVREMSKYIDKYKLIIEKSTVPVNTHKWVERTIKRYIKNKANFEIASNPEFLREGTAINDFLNPDRIVIGINTNKAKKIMEQIYLPFKENNIPIIYTSIPSAEIIKHSSNSFLALKISFINMISDLCEKAGADIEEVANGIGLDSRIGNQFLKAGIGYGGSCFPKDVKAFIRIAEYYGVNFSLLKEVERINKSRIKKIIDLIYNVLWIGKNKTIAVWGLSFKPDTDDIREAPSIKIVKELLEKDVNLKLYDPKAMENFKKVFCENERIKYFKNKYEVLENADVLIILTEWEEFRNIEYSKLKEKMKFPIIIDGRNMFNKKEMQNREIEYYSIGR